MKQLVIILILIFVEHCNLECAFQISRSQSLSRFQNVSALYANSNNQTIIIARDTLGNLTISKSEFDRENDTINILFEKTFELPYNVFDKNNYVFETKDNIIRAAIFYKVADTNSAGLMFVDFDNDGNKLNEYDIYSLFSTNSRVAPLNDSVFVVAFDYKDFFEFKGKTVLQILDIHDKQYTGETIFQESLFFKLNSLKITKDNKIGVLLTYKIDTLVSGFAFYQLNDNLMLENSYITNARVPYNQIGMNCTYDNSFIINWNELPKPDDLLIAYSNTIKINRDNIDTLSRKKLDRADKYFNFIFNPNKLTYLYLGVRQNFYNGVLYGDKAVYIKMYYNNNFIQDYNIDILKHDNYYHKVVEVDSNFYAIENVSETSRYLYRITIRYPYTNDVYYPNNPQLSYYFDSERARIGVDINNSGLYKIIIYDELGKIIESSNEQYLYEGKNYFDLLLNNYKSGLYFFNIIGIDNYRGKFMYIK